MEIQQNEKDKKSKKNLILLIAFLLLVNLGIVYKLYNTNKAKKELIAKNEQLTTSNTSLSNEVASLEQEMNSLKSDNENLKGQLSEKESALNQKLVQIKQLLSKGKLTESEVTKARQEIAALKQEIEEYKLQIQQLKEQVIGLENDKVALNDNLSAEQAKTSQLSQTVENQSKVISKAQKLVIGSITAVAVRERKLFGKKEVETSKASKTEEIKVSFTINRNDVANSGDKDIFVKIIGPDGSPIATKVQTTKVDGTETLYTEMKTIDYQNEKLDATVYCKKQGDYTKGQYTVEVFAEGYKIGGTKFTLN